MIEVSAPAKIILFGEHAVVYGQPAIAVPVSDLRAEAVVVASDHFSIVAKDVSNDAITLDSANPLAETARLALNHFKTKTLPIKINIESSIPIASGLGSGAAITTTIIRAISAFLERDLPLNELNHLVYEIEKIYHGTPSGIDNTVVVYERPVYFIRQKPILRIKNFTELNLLIANTGNSASTRVAVSDVRKLYDAEPRRIKPLIEQIGVIASMARQAMQHGDIAQIGHLMLENQALLKQLTVSSPELDTLIDAAMQSGALGAKLSGGGRGGNMIALVSDDTRDQVKNGLLAAGAVQVYETTVTKD